MFTISKLTTGLPFQGRGGTCHGAMHCISGVMGCVVLGSDTTATPLSKGFDQDISISYTSSFLLFSREKCTNIRGECARCVPSSQSIYIKIKNTQEKTTLCGAWPRPGRLVCCWFY